MLLFSISDIQKCPDHVAAKDDDLETKEVGRETRNVETEVGAAIDITERTGMRRHAMIDETDHPNGINLHAIRIGLVTVQSRNLHGIVNETDPPVAREGSDAA